MGDVHKLASSNELGSRVDVQKKSVVKLVDAVAYDEKVSGLCLQHAEDTQY